MLLPQVAPLRVFRGERGAVAGYLACGVRLSLDGGEGGGGPAGGTAGLLRLGADGLALQGVHLGQFKVTGELVRASAGGCGGRVLRAGLAGDSAQRFKPADLGLLFLPGGVQRRGLGRVRRAGTSPVIGGSGTGGSHAFTRGSANLLDLGRGGIQFGLAAHSVAAAALAVGELLGLTPRGESGFQVGLSYVDKGGGRVALGRGLTPEGRGPGCPPGSRGTASGEAARQGRAGGAGQPAGHDNLLGKLGGVEDGGRAGDGGPRGLSELSDQPGYVRVGVRYLPFCGATTVGQPVLDLAEAVGAEQLLQQGLLLFRVGAQELGELALREEHHLEELGGGHAHEVFYLGVDLTDPG